MNSILTLISQDFKQDEIGNQIPVEKKDIVYCKEKSVWLSEFYKASVAGKKPSKMFEIMAVEYNDQREVEHEGKRYEVIRTYQSNPYKITLTVQDKVGVSNANQDKA